MLSIAKSPLSPVIVVLNSLPVGSSVPLADVSLMTTLEPFTRGPFCAAPAIFLFVIATMPSVSSLMPPAVSFPLQAQMHAIIASALAKQADKVIRIYLSIPEVLK